MNKKKNFFQRMDIESRFGLLRSAMAILIGLSVAVILILISAADPKESLKYFFLGPLQIFNPAVKPAMAWNYFDFWMQNLIPILFTGSAVAIMFSSSKINLGLEGAIMGGGLACAWVCCLLDGDMAARDANPAACIVCGLLVGLIAGALICLVPALLEKWFNANIMVTSLMMNYVMLYVSQYCLFSTSLRDPKTSKYSYHWTNSTVLTQKKFLGTRFTMRWGLIIAIVVVILAWMFLYKTRWGFKARQIGQNPHFAKYVGVSVVSLGVIVQIIGGAIGGLAGATVILGNEAYYYGIEMTGYGWDGVTMAIFSKNDPKKLFVSCAFIAYIRAGALIMSTQKGGPINEMTQIVEGVIILFLLAEQFLSKTHRKMIVADAKEKQAEKLALQGEEVNA